MTNEDITEAIQKEDSIRGNHDEHNYIKEFSNKLFTLQSLPIFFFLIVIVLLSIFVPNFFTKRNIINIFVQSSALGLMTIGMTAVLIGGGIDLSMPAVMAFSGIIGVIFMREGGNPILSGIIMVTIATLGGVVNGIAIGYLKMIPLVVTLATMAIATGASISVTNAQSVIGMQPAFRKIILMDIIGIPMPVVILLFFTVITTYLMQNSLFGRWVYAVGTNEKASKVSGVPTHSVIFGTYVFAGFFAGLAAIITTSRLGSAAATMGKEGVVLDIISSAVVGGVSIYGGVGNPLGAVIGTIVIILISNSMNLLHVSYYITLVIKGAVIIGVVALDSLRGR